jgi:hypothetical protein
MSPCAQTVVPLESLQSAAAIGAVINPANPSATRQPGTARRTRIRMTTPSVQFKHAPARDIMTI